MIEPDCGWVRGMKYSSIGGKSCCAAVSTFMNLNRHGDEWWRAMLEWSRFLEEHHANTAFSSLVSHSTLHIKS